MKATGAVVPSYLPPRFLRDEPPAPPTEVEAQALWFEQYYLPVLTTDDGRRVEVIQPGFWNHTGGPDFTRAAIRFLDGKLNGPTSAAAANGDGALVVGNVEVHLNAGDWNAHGHHADPAYDGTILHVVWEEAVRKPFFPATSKFRRVPQVVLATQLVAPWAELQALCGASQQRPLPGAMPGRCSPELSRLPAAQVLEILRTAGLFRLRQKAQRWHWRARLASREQALHEALAEALGFHVNQIPMRLVAQRLPWKKLSRLNAAERMAHLFGLSGFLPAQSVDQIRAEPRQWLRELWEIWWKARGELDYALLSRRDWKLAGLRPLNRPERRLAALAHLIPRIEELLGAVDVADADRFACVLLDIRDPFWGAHATLNGPPLSAPCRIIGEERVHDILINVFWPMVSLHDPANARTGLEECAAGPNSAARVAAQRLLLTSLTPKQTREALVQQGLLQIFRDYCQTDCSQCRDCRFPELVRAWHDGPPAHD